jgi:hypothetical protein
MKIYQEIARVNTDGLYQAPCALNISHGELVVYPNHSSFGVGETIIAHGIAHTGINHEGSSMSLAGAVLWLCNTKNDQGLESTALVKAEPFRQETLAEKDALDLLDNPMHSANLEVDLESELNLCSIGPASTDGNNATATAKGGFTNPMFNGACIVDSDHVKHQLRDELKTKAKRASKYEEAHRDRFEKTGEIDEILGTINEDKVETLSTKVDFVNGLLRAFEAQDYFVRPVCSDLTFAVSFFEHIEDTVEATRCVFEGDSPICGTRFDRTTGRHVPRAVWKHEVERIVFCADSKDQLLDSAAALYDCIEHANGDTITRSMWPLKASMFQNDPVFAKKLQDVDGLKTQGWLHVTCRGFVGARVWKQKYFVLNVESGLMRMHAGDDENAVVEAEWEVAGCSFEFAERADVSRGLGGSFMGMGRKKNYSFFNIVHPQRDVVSLASDTEQDAIQWKQVVEWVTTLQEAAKSGSDAKGSVEEPNPNCSIAEARLQQGKRGVGLGLDIKMRKDGSIYVTRVHLASALASGINVDDTILAINDQPLKALHFTQVIDIVRSIAVGREVKLKYAREALASPPRASPLEAAKNRRKNPASARRHLRHSVFSKSSAASAPNGKAFLQAGSRGRTVSSAVGLPTASKSLGACDFRALPQPHVEIRK